MKPLRHIITLVCIAASFIADAGEPSSTEGQCAAVLPAAADLKRLQGTWTGADVQDPSLQQVTIKIIGDSFHFHRDADFWFKTTITLPAGKAPKQLHATIKECAPGQENSIGEVVMAIYKIEDGKLTLVTIGEDAEETEHSFDGPGSRYELRKVRPDAAKPKPHDTR